MGRTVVSRTSATLKGTTRSRRRSARTVSPGLKDNLMSVQAVDRRSGAVVFVGEACYILSDGEAVLANGGLSNASVVSSVKESESYVLKRTQVTASARAACTRMDGEVELGHWRFNHLGFSNLKRVVYLVYGMTSALVDAKRMPGAVCVPCVDGKMARSPHHRSATTTTNCESVHTDVDGPLTASLGGAVYFVTLIQDSTEFITATPIKSKSMAPDDHKARIKQLEALAGKKVKRARHDGTKEYVSRDF